MSDMSDYLEGASYDFWFRPGVAAPTRPTAHEVSLWSDVTDEDSGTGTELTDATAPGYTRPSVVFGAHTDGVGSNSAQVLRPFNSGGADWPTVTHYGIHDHLGNLLQSLKQLPAPLAIPPGQRATAEIGDLVISFQ